MAKTLHVEVCLALPERVLRKQVICEEGATCADAVRASGLLDEAQGLGIDVAGVGVYAKRKAATDPVFDGDRIEIYRPLVADPKTARARRAVHQRAQRTTR